MEHAEINETRTTRASWDYNTIHKITAIFCAIIAWHWIAVAMCIDDDLLIFLPFIILPFIIALPISHFASSKLLLEIHPNCLTGKYFFNKDFHLQIADIQSVRHFGINGIKIICSSGKIYKFSYITNRDDVCTSMKNIGMDVDITLIKDINSFIASEPDTKKHKLFRNLSLVFPILGNVFLTLSGIWYISDGNYYYKTYTDYYNINGYEIPFTNGYWAHHYYAEDMFTTYIAIACYICFIIFTILYFVMANNKITISTSMVRGINGFGKVNLISVDQITGANIDSKNSVISINQMGKVYKYFWLMNNTQLCATISDIKSRRQSAIIGENANTISDVVSNTVGTENSQSIAEMSEEIKQLKSLLDDGIISKKEFDTKKKQILDL